MKRWALVCCVLVFPFAFASGSEPIRLANNPALSPDGQWLAFDWNGDIWLAPASGGEAKQRTGGSITDHLLTALTQPNHAITVPRGGGPGYPMDRKIYVSWHKPIVVLCNQNSGSNAEIFSHAIKTLKRGQLVGVQTAGAVVSTGAVSVMDAGMLRLPTRGWFTINDGEDMEKHGALPHHVIWLAPSHLPQGRDVQLEKALEVLQADVAAWKGRPQPKLKLSTERP